MVLLMLVGCRSIKYVEKPVEVEKIKTEYVKDIQKDSIYIKDSIFIRQAGDTVYNTKVQIKNHYIFRNDTVIVVDSIPKIVTVTEVREVNVLHKWQKFLMLLGGSLTGAIILYLIVKLKKLL